MEWLLATRLVDRGPCLVTEYKLKPVVVVADSHNVAFLRRILREGPVLTLDIVFLPVCTPPRLQLLLRLKNAGKLKTLVSLLGLLNSD